MCFSKAREIVLKQLNKGENIRNYVLWLISEFKKIITLSNRTYMKLKTCLACTRSGTHMPWKQSICHSDHFQTSTKQSCNSSGTTIEVSPLSPTLLNFKKAVIEQKVVSGGRSVLLNPHKMICITEYLQMAWVVQITYHLADDCKTD